MVFAALHKQFDVVVSSFVSVAACHEFQYRRIQSRVRAHGQGSFFSRMPRVCEYLVRFDHSTAGNKGTEDRFRAAGSSWMSLTPDRWHSLEELFAAALDLPASQRAAFLKGVLSRRGIAARSRIAAWLRAPGRSPPEELTVDPTGSDRARSGTRTLPG